MARNDFEDIVDQLEHELSASATRASEDVVQNDLNDIASFVSSIYKDDESSTQPLELKVKQQPQLRFSFRFKSQIKESNGYLHARNNNERGCKNYPSVELRQSRNKEYVAEGNAYLIRCSLHQALAVGEKNSFISPHLLCRRRHNEAAVYAEMEMLPFTKVTPLLYSYTLKNFTILKTARKDWLQVLIHKMQERQENNLPGTDCSELRAQLSREDYERIANEQVKKPQHQVRLCFEAFQRTTQGYVQVAGPIYSDCIKNGDSPQIELCNKSAAMHELTIMTIKVNTVRPKDKILIFHHNNDDDDGDYESSDWRTTITVEEQMIHEQSAVSFQMPIYRDNKGNNGEDIIKCSIQLERLTDGALSNKAIFYYIDTIKRRTNQLELKKKSRLLQEELFSLYKISKTMKCEQRSKFIRDVREYYKSYELAHSDGNSLLHDILLDTDAKVHDMDLCTIVKHFELQDLVSRSINIYDETVLMFACMLSRPLLMQGLIQMGSSITVQEAEYGNNVLHIAMQQQSAECRNSLMQAMRTNSNAAASFIKALGSHNVQGMTPLHLAVLRNNVPIVAELLEYCKRQNAFEVCQLGQLSDGNTILHLAVLNRFATMRTCILEHSGESFVNLINYANKTAEDLERHRG